MLVLFKIIQSKKIEGGTESVKLQSGTDSHRGQSVEPWLTNMNPFYTTSFGMFLGSTLYKSCLLIILINK